MRFHLPVALLLTACGTTPTDTSDDTTPPPDEVVADLEKADGGFDLNDEAPMFADDALFTAADFEEDRAFADDLASDASLTAMERDTASGLVEGHNLIVMWGKLPADPAETEWRTWDGELKVSRGGLLVRRTIAFEDRTDRVLPRTSRDAVAFVSRTMPRADGLALTVYDNAPVSSTDALTLTYSPKDGSAPTVVNLRELATGPIVIDAGDGNKIVVASRPRKDRCDHGFMRGRWHALSRSSGHFAGLVLNAEGEPVGHVRGIYGERRDGSSVVFGKFINREGGFRGLLRGTYDDGKWNTRWIDRAGDHGVAHGVYLPGPTLRAGHFLGRWAEASCAGR